MTTLYNKAGQETRDRSLNGPMFWGLSFSAAGRKLRQLLSVIGAVEHRSRVDSLTTRIGGISAANAPKISNSIFLFFRCREKRSEAHLRLKFGDFSFTTLLDEWS